MHNLGKLTYQQRLAIMNGRSTKDIPGLTFSQKLAIQKDREGKRNFNGQEEPKPSSESEPLVVEQAGPGEPPNSGGSPDVQPAPSEDKEAPEERLEVPKKRAPAKKKVSRKKA